MTRRTARLLLALPTLLAFLPFSAAHADERDRASLQVSQLFVGQRAVLSVELVGPAGAAVAVDPAAASWAGVEVLAVVPTAPEPTADGLAIYRFTLTVAPFAVGQGSFAPSFTILTGEGAQRRELPPLSWDVVPTLDPAAPLELSPLAAPTSIAGAESPFLRPAAAAGVLLFLAGLGWLGWRLARWLNARRPVPLPGPVAVEPVTQDFSGVEGLLDNDPVAAYRTLATVVRSVIGSEYGFPATALTTTEIRRRMESSGANRFQARLVGGFLENCDAVVYAGYRPAGERRRADLTMAREIVGGEG